MDNDHNWSETQDHGSSEGPGPAPDRDDPAAIGRYRVIRRLGQGGFGRVYLARDDDLDRPVAIKVPNPGRIAGPGDVETYVNEAKALARLDHRHIVPVYDVGRTADGHCFVVSKYIDGSDLAGADRRGAADGPRGGGDGGDRRRGAASRAHPGPGPPRHQAGEHPDRRGRHPLGGRFRPGAEGRGLRQGRPAGRHARLHEPRAGPRRGPPGRRPFGSLQPGRGALRAAHRSQAVPRRQRDEVDGPDRRRRAAAAPPDRRRPAPRAGADLPEGPVEARLGAVQHRPRHGRGPPPLPPDRAAHRAGDSAADAAVHRRRDADQRADADDARAGGLRLGGAGGPDRPQGAAVVRPARRQLLPRAAPRPPRPRGPARGPPVLEDADRVERPRRHVQGGPGLRPVGVRQVVDGQGRAAASAAQGRPDGLRRGDPRGDRGPAAPRAPQGLPRARSRPRPRRHDDRDPTGTRAPARPEDPARARPV